MSSKAERTLLVLGPPHSGKSVFAYLLFKTLLNLGNDCALVDGDLFSPTLRPYNFGTKQEQDHIYVAGHYGKRRRIPIDVYSSDISNTMFFVIERGAIVLDGLGRHTDATEFLLEVSARLFVVCRDEIDNGELEKCHYKIEDSLCHPFEFYRDRKDDIIKVTSHLATTTTSFDERSLESSLCGLRRRAIRNGNVDNIPESTRNTMEEIAQFALNNWL